MDLNFTLGRDGGPPPVQQLTPAQPPPADPSRRPAWVLPAGVVATLLAGAFAGLLLTPSEEPALKPGQPIMPVELARTAPAPAMEASPGRLEVLPAGPAAAPKPPSSPAPDVQVQDPGEGVLTAPQAFAPEAPVPRPPPQYAPRRLEPPPPDEVERERFDDAPRYAPPPRWARRPLDDPEELDEDEEPSA